METATINVSIYSAYKPGIPGDRGPNGLKQYIGVAGVSGLDCRPEFFGVSRNIPKDVGEIVIDKEVGSLGSPPYRKRITIQLPANVHYGSFEFANCHMDGLYSDYSATDGMGPCVGVWCRQSILFDNHDYEAAIDAAIASGIILYAPTKDGARAEIPVRILEISHIFGNKFENQQMMSY